ncbi:amidase signature enzyme [Aspergillus uvarum CBS 121591]|uniref:Amidase signature enzyme n=1 Tax=Aspergillus uvarum CBS 121591 TaxID=1448315 RepID=A0A319BQX0_9EURO|nr:amidase signature enzyme [Aspergillus uvarum CBS 121591]PYH75896.1 amidase signature enzyme [Aspergillus uvarum CBS 121591]
MTAAALLLATLPICAFASSVAHVLNVPYYVPSKVELAHEFKVQEALPVTVLTSQEAVITASWINSTVSDFLVQDDVYTKGFFYAFYFQGPEGLTLAGDADSLLKTFGTSRVFWASSQHNATLPDGPYFATSSGLHRAWRLYDDYTNAFVLPTIPSANDINTYEVLPASGGDLYGAMQVAVPSRLFYRPTAEQPLAGYRIGVKDQYDIKGLITTFGSRSYAATYPPSNVTSGVIQHLLDQGAVVVGKTKLSVFANAWFSIAEWPDYSLPFNPRGESYLIPGASSAGSGASLAAYDWLDITIGEDTGGSMRFPAAQNGVYGIRSTKNSTNNTATVFGPFDVAGHFARDVDSFNTFGAVMYGQSGYKNYTKFPAKILYPREYWANINPNYTAPCEEYVQNLEAFLGVNRTIVDSNALWHEYSGSNVSLADYFANLIPYVSGTYNFSLNFKKDYFAKFGRYPYSTLNAASDPSFTPQNASLGEIGHALQSEFQTFYRRYFLSANEETCSDAIVVFPFNGNGGIPWYRDSNISYTVAGSAPALPGYISWNYLSVMNESPEVAVPVGTVQYHSRVSLVEEEFPATVEIQGAVGCDFMLMNLVRAVAYEQGLRKGVRTGSRMY